MAKFTIKKSWKDNSLKILDNYPNKNKIIDTLFTVLNQIERNDWQGACHATCGVLHVLLSEQGIESKLILGEVRKENVFFNHSWIEIDGEIYDLAIANPLVHEYGNPPTIKGQNIETLKTTEVEYGVDSGLEEDMPTTIIKSIPLSEYFNNFPGHPTLGLWVMVLDSAKQLGLSIDLKSCQSKHEHTLWTKR